MKTFAQQAAQGDILITRIDAPSAKTNPVAPVNGSFILSHDAGHPHLVGATGVACAQDAGNPMILFLTVDQETRITHSRPFDTHEDIVLAPGVYEVRRQREWTPEGFRAVVD